MKRVKLKVMGISYSQTQSGAYALILIEENGERRIPIIIGGFEAQAIVIKLENLDPPRPLTHDLFKKFADEFNIFVSEVMIYKLEEGVFFSKLVCNNGEKEYSIDSRTSDAVALALRFGCPIFITEDILEKAGITINPTEVGLSTANEIDSLFEPESTKYDSYSDEELYKMIDESVKTEDYERAAAIRDEIEKRKKSK
ncbi:MAG: bifunctional nuclease family protein [Bacteroidales bacterium]|nr:bifunctional nuclease family protein [Bacteroidales bacterium]MDP3002033.1 bifunctional nuclease family protein [Bacteroidales bacterium]